VQQGSSCRLRRYSALIACLLTPIAAGAEPQAEFPVLPLPPPVEGLVGLSKSLSVGRLTHMRLVRQEAQQRGVPPEVADAVAQVESAYNPHAVGTVGEVGLMQVRPTTAVLLGHSGTIAESTRAKHEHPVWCPLPRRGLEACERQSLSCVDEVPRWPWRGAVLRAVR